MPMGSLNSSTTFVVTMMKLQMEWYEIAKECGFKKVAWNYYQWYVTVLEHIRTAPGLFQNSTGCTKKPPHYTKTEKVKMASRQVQFCSDQRGSRRNTTFTVKKWGFFLAIETKYMGRPPHDHWDIWILQPVLSPIWSGYHTLDHLIKEASSRNNISNGVDVTDAEPMDTRWPNVTGTAE